MVHDSPESSDTDEEFSGGVVIGSQGYAEALKPPSVPRNEELIEYRIEFHRLKALGIAPRTFDAGYIESLIAISEECSLEQAASLNEKAYRVALQIAKDGHTDNQGFGTLLEYKNALRRAIDKTYPDDQKMPAPHFVKVSDIPHAKEVAEAAIKIFDRALQVDISSLEAELNASEHEQSTGFRQLVRTTR